MYIRVVRKSFTTKYTHTHNVLSLDTAFHAVIFGFSLFTCQYSHSQWKRGLFLFSHVYNQICQEWREAKEEQTCSIRAQVERKWQMFRCEGFQSKIMEKLENYTGTNSLCVFERGEQKRKINIVVRLNYIICLILTQFH